MASIQRMMKGELMDNVMSGVVYAIAGYVVGLLIPIPFVNDEKWFAALGFLYGFVAG